jgi:hypothetical protein
MITGRMKFVLAVSETYLLDLEARANSTDVVILPCVHRLNKQKTLYRFSGQPGSRKYLPRIGRPDDARNSLLSSYTQPFQTAIDSRTSWARARLSPPRTAIRGRRE